MLTEEVGHLLENPSQFSRHNVRFPLLKFLWPKNCRRAKCARESCTSGIFFGGFFSHLINICPTTRGHALPQPRDTRRRNFLCSSGRWSSTWAQKLLEFLKVLWPEYESTWLPVLCLAHSFKHRIPQLVYTKEGLKGGTFSTFHH